MAVQTVRQARRKPTAVVLTTALVAALSAWHPLPAAAAKWPQPGGLGTTVEVSYSHSNLLDGGLQRATGLEAHELILAVEEALAVWTSVVPLRFTAREDSGLLPVDDTDYFADAHPQIRFGRHSLAGNVLAHAYYPGNGGLAGDVHFDSSDRSWSETTFLYVAAHELGHSIGLDHIEGVTALMNATAVPSRFSPGLGHAQLWQPDIDAARALYGSGSGEVIGLRVWQGTAGDNNWATHRNWDPACIPTASSSVYFRGGSPLNVQIGTHSARSLTVDNVSLGLSGGGLTLSHEITIDNAGQLALTTQGAPAELTAAEQYVGKAAAGAVTQAVGVNTILAAQYLGYNRGSSGTYHLSGSAEVSSQHQYLGFYGTGTFVQDGGTNGVADSILLGNDRSANGTYNLNGGTLLLSKGTDHNLTVSVRGTGLFNLGDAASTGTIGETGAGAGVGLTLREFSGGSATLHGWGNVQLTGALENNGRIVADGYGSDRLLDLSAFSSVTSNDAYGVVQGDGTLAGWYAEDFGKLALPPIPVAVGTGTYNWGEDPSDGSIDLVGSARVTLANVASGGPLSISLLSRDHGNSLGMSGDSLILGLWEIAPPLGFAFDAADLTFRYDDALAAALGLGESQLSVYRFTHGSWIDVTSSVDTANNRISTQGVDALSVFAVGSGVTVANQWQQPGGGSYNAPANWTGNTVPDGTDAAASFLGWIASPSTVTVDLPVTVGTINFDNVNAYLLAGPAAVTLETFVGAARINVRAGQHTISAPLVLASDLTVNTERGSSLTLIPDGLSIARNDLTKEGPGTCVLGGTFVALGGVDVRGGTFQVGPDLLALSGGDVNIAAGAILKAGGTVNRRVLGAVGSTLEAGGTMDVGLLDDPNGYDFQGKLIIGPYMLGLKDADRAKVYKGATIAGGTLSSFNGLELQEGSVFPSANRSMSGYGTLAGAVHLVNAVVWGSSSAQMITMPGVVTGMARLLNNVALTGLNRLGASPVYTPMSGSLQSSEMEVWGGKPFVFDKELFAGVGGEYSQFGAVGPLTLGGDLTVKLMGGFVPGPANQFRMFESLDIPEYTMDGYYEGWFNKLTLPVEMQGWYWVYGLADGSSSLQVPTGPYETATLMIPEPGTLLLLTTGAFGLLLGTIRRVVGRRRGPSFGPCESR